MTEPRTIDESLNDRSGIRRMRTNQSETEDNIGSFSMPYGHNTYRRRNERFQRAGDTKMNTVK